MKIYLDNCCYNRPFDDQSQIKIKLDTIAVLHIQHEIKKGVYQLTWSDILDFENGKTPFDYTEWRKDSLGFENMSAKELGNLAHEYSTKIRD